MSRHKDAPSPSELAYDTCIERACEATNERPYSTRCYYHASVPEQRDIDVARADDRVADQDWGEVPC